MPEQDLAELFSWQWFQPSTLKSFHWDSPFFLYLIPLVVLLPIFRWLFHVRFRQKVEIGTPVPKRDFGYYFALLRFVPVGVFLFFVIMILLALARPQTLNSAVSKKVKGIDLLFVLDISESMMLEDFVPNRLEVAKSIVSDFIKTRVQDKIGLVVFSGAAYSLLPLTTDYDLLQSNLAHIKTNELDTGATAIGNALGVGINRLRNSPSKTKLMILLTDGDNTAGNLSPATAAMLAKKFNIKIYTIGVGKNGEAPFGKTAEGYTNWVTSTLNEASLKEIAQLSDGAYFRATDKPSLKKCFAKINKLAKNSFTIDTATSAEDFYTYYLYWSLIALLAWLGLKSSFMNNFMED